jgi:hypothetical protein
VTYYRLYLLADPDGRFIGFEEIDAADDVEAVHLAERHRGEHPLELWCGRRKVRNFPVRPSIGASFDTGFDELSPAQDERG